MPLKIRKINNIYILELKITLNDMKYILVRLSGNYFIAKMKLVKILDPLLTYTPAISGCVCFLEYMSRVMMEKPCFFHMRSLTLNDVRCFHDTIKRPNMNFIAYIYILY